MNKVHYLNKTHTHTHTQGCTNKTIDGTTKRIYRFNREYIKWYSVPQKCSINKKKNNGDCWLRMVKVQWIAYELQCRKYCSDNIVMKVNKCSTVKDAIQCWHRQVITTNRKTQPAQWFKTRLTPIPGNRIPLASTCPPSSMTLYRLKARDMTSSMWTPHLTTILKQWSN